MHYSLATWMTVGLLLSAAPALAQAPIQKLRTCLVIEDMSRERLDCYDGIVPPQPQPAAAKPKTIIECRFLQEEDERLICYNTFLQGQNSPGRTATVPPPPSAPPPPVTTAERSVPLSYVRKGRGGCGSRGGPGYRLPNGQCASHRHATRSRSYSSWRSYSHRSYTRPSYSRKSSLRRR